MISLKEKPFYLNDQDIAWVEKTIAGMSNEDKIGQLFCLIAYDSNEHYLKGVVNGIKPGGLMCRPMPLDEVVSSISIIQETAQIPMLIAANLESGGTGLVLEGTKLGSPMLVGATNHVENAYHMGVVCGREGAAVGGNWSFAPIIDLDYNFRNPITNTRTFGSDVERVKNMGVAYVKGVQENGVAASIKHFPGDGRDERDQHLVTSINDFSCEEWDATYGAVYSASIEQGAMTVMIGHIMQPAYSKFFNPEIKDADILPASLSKELVNDLLRGRLGFNGLVVTDATTMAGMTIPMPRERAVPLSISAGCDMFLFARNLEEDYGYMKKGVEEGVISQERLDEAVTRILALKAALKLHQKQADGTLIPSKAKALPVLRQKEHVEWAQTCADEGITLVKEQAGVLPLSPEKYKKVLLYGIESELGMFYSVRAGITDRVKELLTQEGLDVELFAPKPGLEGMVQPFSEIADKYDLIVYLANMATKSNQTVVRIEWAQPMGANVPIYMESVPTVFISVENPYHLIDVPRVKTFINTYTSSDIALESLIEKLMGRSEFKGVNPVDPFCGRWDTRL
ncbi:MAG: glycoside hydrolase family 3 protein [Vallitaleaceae bacterium]|nr:glycoside hydrolase family 3 protein [Vallitaleaceae bacterium]